MPIPDDDQDDHAEDVHRRALGVEGRLQVGVIGLPRIHFVTGQAGLHGVDHGRFLAELFQRNHHLGGLAGQAVQVLGFGQRDVDVELLDVGHAHVVNAADGHGALAHLARGWRARPG